MVADRPPLVLGLDLHGTLLEPGEILRPELIEPVETGLRKLKGRTLRLLCTGNDLEFVLRKVPEKILQQIDGHVLETGCSASLDKKTERVLTDDKERETIRGLEAYLKNAGLSEINYFAHRLTTISMFCDDPRGFHAKVDRLVKDTDYYSKVQITYSSVAVDILPRGYDKHTGLARLAQGRPTIGVADSMNDRALLERADYAYAPANMAPELVPLLEKQGRKIAAMEKTRGLVRNTVVLASSQETQGVIEILDFLDRTIPGPETGPPE